MATELAEVNWRRVARAAAVLLVCAVVFTAAWVQTHPAQKSVAGSSEAGPPVGAAVAGKHWTVEFNDNFNGDALDSTLWSPCYWWSADGCTNGSSGELEWYQSANVTTANGSLVLQARKQSVVGSDGRDRAYTSGMVSGAGPDRNLFTFEYGYVEARVWIPAGPGLWSAFWMLPASRETLPEIDIFEAVGERPDDASEHVHWKSSSDEMQLGSHTTVPGAAAGWHTYAVDWEPGSLTWYIDGTERWKVTKSAAIPDTPMYLLADLAVGGAYTEPPTSATPFPSSMKIDYVRVWQDR